MKPVLFSEGKGVFSRSSIWMTLSLLLLLMRNVYAMFLLSSLGFIVNEHKSMLSPSRACRFLGFLFDSEDFSVSIPLDKRRKLLDMTLSFLDMKSCRIRVFASYIGSLISVRPAVRYSAYQALGASEISDSCSCRRELRGSSDFATFD